MRVELVLDAKAELGEGPIWDAARSRLVFMDINRHQVHEFDPVGGGDRVLQFDRCVTAVGVTARGGWIAAAGWGFAEIDPPTGRLTPIVDAEPPGSRRRMNDGAVDPRGRFWGGSMSLDRVEGQGSLYRLDSTGVVTRVVSPVTTSNGPAWSPDGRVMYYVDTRTRRIDALDFDVETGDVSARRPFVEFREPPGRPDGVIVDAEGGVWVALWEGAEVRRYRADGRLDIAVPMPTRFPTKCAFGGEDLRDLYVTTARAPLDENARVQDPVAGGLFRLRPGVQGLAASLFR